MTLIKYKNPTEYSFYKWIRSYPNSKYWKERIKKCPEVMGCPEIDKFYRFVKTACKNGASTIWLNWNEIEKKILRERPNFDKDELKILKDIFENLVNFYKTPAVKQDYSVENLDNVKKGYCIGRWFAKGEFHEKEIPINIPKRRSCDI